MCAWLTRPGAALGTGTMEISQSGPTASGVVTTSRVLRLVVAGYLARFKGQSRVHTDSDLRGYLVWCGQRELDPLAASRPHIELYLRSPRASRPAAPGWNGTAPPADYDTSPTREPPCATTAPAPSSTATPTTSS